MNWSDMTTLLDDVIAKGQGAESDLKKALSFNPMAIQEMNGSQPYHCPYRLLEDGSYAPHTVDDLLAMTGAKGPNARDSYREVELFLRRGEVDRVTLDMEIDDLVKGGRFSASLGHEDKIKLVRHHLKRRSSEARKKRDSDIDKKVKEHVDGAFKEYHENLKIKKRVDAQMQKRTARSGSKDKKTK